MTHHFTRSTVATSAWCPHCRSRTQHRVDTGRLGPCLNCVDRLQREHEEREERAAILEYDAGFTRATAEVLARVRRRSTA